MIWSQFENSHAFCASISATNGKEVSDAEETKIAALCAGTKVDFEVSPQRTQIWLGGLQSEVIEVLDKLNSIPTVN